MSLQCPYNVIIMSLQCPYNVITMSLQWHYNVPTNLVRSLYFVYIEHYTQDKVTSQIF